MRAAAVGAAVAIALVSACSGSGGSPVATTTPPVTSVATTIAPTTTTALAPQPSPDVAAVALLNAWRTGDRVTARRVATAAAVTALFARPAQDFSDRGCQDPVGGQSNCAFGLGGGLLQLHAVTLAGGWIVDQASFDG